MTGMIAAGYRLQALARASVSNRDSKNSEPELAHELSN
jgi:hypothetical protein